MNDLTEDRLRDGLEAIARWADPVEVPALPDARIVPLRAAPRRKPFRWAAAAAAVIAVALVARTIAGIEPLPVTSGDWLAMADAPIVGRGNAAAVWTGDEVVIVGGEAEDGTFLRDAAAYDPYTNRWRRLPDPPAVVPPGSDAVWTGEEMVIVPEVPELLADAVGLAEPDREVHGEVPAVALDPLTGAWRVLDPPDGLALATVAVDGAVTTLVRRSTHEAVVVQLDEGLWVERARLAMPDLNLDLDLAARWSGGTMDGDAVFVAQRLLDLEDPDGLVGGIVLDIGTGSVTAIGLPPVSTGDEGPRPWMVESRATVGDDGVVVSGLDLGNEGQVRWIARRWTPASGWSFADAPPAMSQDEHLLAATRFVDVGGDDVLVGGIAPFDLGSAGLHHGYDPEEDRWVELPDPPLDLDRVGHVAVWTGTDLVVWGGLVETGAGSVNRPDLAVNDGARYRLR